MDIPVVKWNRRYRWYHVDSSVGEEGMAWLKKEFGFHDLDLEDCAAEKTQRPKGERYEDHSFYIFHFAVLDDGDRVKVQELKVFIGDDFLVTIAKFDLPVREWFQTAQKDGESTFLQGNTGLLLYILVDRLTDRGLSTVRRLGVN